MFLFVEIFVCTMFALERGDQNKYIFTLFAAYLGGVVCFCLFPVFEPYLLQQACMDSCMEGSITLRIVSDLRHEFVSALRLWPVTGQGYFVGFPSLHVAVSVISLYYFAASRSYWYFFLPVNIMIVVSTVFLGYHYLLDMPAGVVLAIFSLWATRIGWSLARLFGPARNATTRREMMGQTCNEHALAK